MTLRDSIICSLEKARGKYVSEQEIAESLCVSPSEVAKCISSLKDKGYPIKSANNLGYSLDIGCDILSVGGIQAYLNEDLEIRVFQSIDSTNSEAKREVSNGLALDTIFASESQTAGRGRHGHSFYSPDRSGIYFSCLLHPELSLQDSTSVTSAAAVSVCEAIEEATKKEPGIKWVNDIFIDGKKICGILTEAVSDFESGRVRAIIVGIGINLTTESFPDELKDIAASLDCRLNRCALIADIFKRLKGYCAALPDKSFMDKYRARSLVFGRQIRFNQNGTEIYAEAKAIHDNGELEVITSRGDTVILNSGEISIKL